MIYTAKYHSPVGKLTIVSNGRAITGLWMENQRYFPEIRETMHGIDLPVIQQSFHWLDCYFTGSCQLPVAPPLSLHGTAFQIKVWEALLTIPYGETRTYSQIAAMISEKGAACARAVGNAVGRNPVSILVPCHRIVPANGTVGFYAGGTDRKAYLLALEK